MAIKKSTKPSGIKVTTDSSGRITTASDSSGTYNVSNGIAVGSKGASSNYSAQNLATNQAAYGKGGSVAGASTVQTPVTAPIAADALGATQSIQMPTPNTDTTGATAMAAGAEAGAKSLDTYIKEITPPETETGKQYNDILGSINNLLPELGNKKAEQAKVEKQLGIPDTRKQLAELNGLMTSRLAEYNKAIAETETAPGETPLGLVLGRQAVIRRNQAADLGLLQARGLALQGQLEAAQETANRAIDLKYGTMEDTINIKMQQLQLIQPILDKEERTYAAALERKYSDEKEALAEKKAKAKENLALAWSSGISSGFVNKGGEFFRVSDGKTYSDPAEFFKDAGVTSFEDAYRRGIVSDLNAQRLSDIEFVTQLRAKYGDAGINPYEDTPESAVAKLQNSYLYGKETYMEPPSSSGFGESISIGGVPHFLSPDGTLVPATDFVAGGVAGNQPAYTDQAGGQLKFTGTQADSIASFDTTIASAQQALNLLSQGTGTGPLEKFSLTTGKLFNKADPNKLQLEQLVGQLKANFIKALSGAAVSEQEVKRLSQFLPSLSDQEGVFKSKLETLIQQSSLQKQNLLQAVGGQANPNFTGPTFNQAGNASASNQVKGTRQSIPYAQQIDPRGIGNKANTIGTVAQKIFPQGSVGGQCGDFVRKLAGKFGVTYPAVGDSLKSKIASVQKYGVMDKLAGKVGSVMISKDNPTYGHVAYVIGKNAQGYIVAESNYKQSNRVSYGRVIPFNSPNLVGFINPTPKA